MTTASRRKSRPTAYLNKAPRQQDNQSHRVLALRYEGPRRGLRREDAATYVGVGVTTFDDLVRQGIMPAPTRFKGCVVWDLRALDRAWDDHVGNTSNDNEWNEVL